MQQAEVQGGLRALLCVWGERGREVTVGGMRGGMRATHHAVGTRSTPHAALASPPAPWEAAMFARTPRSL